jgi:hypothetical protein
MIAPLVPSAADVGRTMADLQASHISANAPLDTSFGKVLLRDIAPIS